MRNKRGAGERGFTLIELVAVMAILAILVAIVAPAAINSERASITAQAQSDSPQVRNAAGEFFTKRNESEVRTPHTVTLSTRVNDVTTTTAQTVSSRWPEIYVTQATSSVPSLSGKSASSKYSAIFETVASPKVVNVVLLKADGATISVRDLLTKFTAIDLTTLVSDGLLSKLPDGVGKTSATGVGSPELKVPNFLWLFKKQSSSLGTDDNRVVTVFTLVKVDQIEASGGAATVNLTYEQILGP